MRHHFYLMGSCREILTPIAKVEMVDVSPISPEDVAFFDSEVASIDRLAQFISKADFQIRSTRDQLSHLVDSIQFDSITAYLSRPPSPSVPDCPNVRHLRALLLVANGAILPLCFAYRTAADAFNYYKTVTDIDACCRANNHPGFDLDAGLSDPDRLASMAALAAMNAASPSRDNWVNEICGAFRRFLADLFEPAIEDYVDRFAEKTRTFWDRIPLLDRFLIMLVSVVY
jgi:hypothetical protein